MNTFPAMVGEHRVFDFCGTPFEIGRQHGSALRQRIEAEFVRVSTSLAERSGGVSRERVVERLFEAYEPLFRQRLPMAIEEIRGLAEGCGLSYPQMFFVAAGDGAPTMDSDKAAACTAFACGNGTTANGHVLMGQNKDTGTSTERYQITRYSYRPSGRRMVLLNYPGWIANIGITSDGLGLAGNARYAAAPKCDTVPFSLLKRLVMESSSIQQVLDGIRGLSFENGAFLVGERSGRLTWIECIAGTVRITDVSDQAFGQANSVLSEDLRKHEDAVLGSPSSPTRQKNIRKRLDEKRGAITLEVLQKILADHENYPMSICRHACDADPLHTSAAFVADLNDLEMRIAIGNPCAAEFKTYRMPD